jgi:hypothetical protein
MTETLRPPTPVSLHRPLARRRFLAAAGAMTLSAIASDQLWGGWEATGLSREPATEVIENPQAGRTVIIAGGLANDGIAMGRAMKFDLASESNMLSVRYAATNVRPELLSKAIEESLRRSNLLGQRLDVYLGSAAGIILAEPLRLLRRRIGQFGTIVLDCAPCDKHDIKGLQGAAVRGRLDFVKYSRALNTAMRRSADAVMPPITDRAANIPAAAALAHREAIVRADSITSGVQAEALRKADIGKLALAGVAEKVVYLQALEDPLIHIRRASEGWRRVYGDLRDVIDPYRPSPSHAVGPLYPRGVAEVLTDKL